MAAAMTAAAGGAVSVAVSSGPAGFPQGPDGQAHNCRQRRQHNQISQYSGHVQSLPSKSGYRETAATELSRRDCSSP